MKQKKKFSGVLIICIINLIMFIITFGGNIFVDFLGNYYEYTLKHFQLWRLFTCIFIHGGIIHLICNTISLLQLGILIESKYGRQNFLFIYILSGIGASIMSAMINMIFSRDIISIGASGAICGLLGFLFGKLKGNIKNSIISLFFIIIPFIIVGISGGNVDNIAHFGGIISGFLIGRLFVKINIKDNY